MRGLLAILFAWAQAEDVPAGLDPNVYRLARIKVKMEENLRQLPNYTCVQTVERSRRLARGRRFELLDTIRLEVAMVGGKELYSWPGASKFEEKELRDLVGGGTIGNGTFGLHARSVFLGNGPVFQFDAEFVEDGRKLVRYRYNVPRLLSGYTLRIGEQKGIAGYYGSFDVHAQTLDLARLEVNASEIPPHLPLSSARDQMEYQRVRIGEADFLLPRSSELVMVDLNGSESRNRTHFSGCRQYTGESVVSFAEPPPAESGAALGTVPAIQTPAIQTLREGEFLDVRLDQGIRFGEAAVGDRVYGTLLTNLKTKGRVLLPKGAVLRGRVRLIEKYMARVEIIRIGLELEEAEFPGGRSEFLAKPSTGGMTLPGVRTTVDERGIIYISGTRRELPQGTRLYWRVESTTGRKEQ